MTNDTERRIAKRVAQAMRTAALRLALEQAGPESDSAVTYGCVDWFRYDAPSQPEEVDVSTPLATARHDAGREEASLRH